MRGLKRLRWLAAMVCILVALSPGALAAQEADEPPHFDRIKMLVEPYLKNDKFVGASVGIFIDGKEYYLNYGHTKKGGPEPTNETIYEIGSISKVFTGLLLADAVAREELTLDTTVGSMIPSLGEKAEASDITLLELTHHMSGLPRMPANIRPKEQTNPFADYDRKKLDTFLARVTLSKPGEGYAYSNLGAGLLGDLLSRRAEMSYEELLRQRILEPAGMKDTTIELSESQLSRMADPHNGAGLPDHRWSFDALVGAGGIRSTTRDMVQFMKLNLDPPEGPLGDALNLAWKQHLPPTDDHRAMGLGWMIAGDGQGRWHNGQTGGYQSMFLANREYKLGVVVLSNTAGSSIDPLAEGIFRALLGVKEKPQNFDPVAEVSPETAQRLAGRYRLALFSVIEVKANGNKLMVQLSGQPAIPVFPESDTVWNYRVVEAQLQFELPEGDGPATKVTLFQNGRELPAPRIGDK